MDLPKTRKEALDGSIGQYFTGKPCPRGHLSPKRTSCYACIACEKERDYQSDNIKRYGIIPEEYQRMVLEQNRMCKICGKPFQQWEMNGDKRDAFIDHCHTTDKIRGILCSNCNSAVGFLENNASHAANVAAYLGAK